MRLYGCIGVLLFLCACSFSAGKTEDFSPPYEYNDESINGLTFVATPKPYSEQAMKDITSVHANWISVIPYGYQQLSNPAVKYNIDWQWWGEKPSGVRKTIRDAHSSNLKVMLKPQIYIPGGFTGDMSWETEEQWSIWETGFEAYILDFAQIAEDEKVALFCIGTEYKNAVQERPAFWLQLIQKIRTVYKGKLTYASNWDEYSYVQFWNELDYVGVDAYYELSNVKTPTVQELLKAWEKPMKELEQFSRKVQKPILFTEYGYLSVGNCCSRTWELEKGLKGLPVNERCQRNAIEALHTAMEDKPWWAGSFLWKWFPDGMGHEGHPLKDYTPQGKEAEELLRVLFNE